MSPGGMALIAPVNGKAGERVIVYVDHIGRLEGAIARQFPNGFAMTDRRRRRASATSSPPSSPGSPTGMSSACPRTAVTTASSRAIPAPSW